MTRYNNIALFGCKSTTLFLLRALHDAGVQVNHLITIDAATGQKNEVADYYDLAAEASAMGVEVYTARQYNLKHADDLAHITGLGIDIAFVMGWQRLVPAELLSSFSVGAFGMHGSSMNLPLGRGRSPMNWSILEGRSFFYTNLFRYDPGVDSGDVVDTFKFQVTGHDTGETMHYKNLLAMKYLVQRNMEKLRTGTFALAKQRDDIPPTYYPKRSPDDSLIDWAQDVTLIERFIRAVTRPFNGAFTFAGDEKVIIWRAQLFDHEDFGYESVAEGAIAAVFPGGKLLVKCFGGLLLVHEYTTNAVMKEGMLLGNGTQALKVFPRNSQGFFDVPEY